MNRRSKTVLRAARGRLAPGAVALCLAAVLAPTASAAAGGAAAAGAEDAAGAVRVIVGPTPIRGGEARAAHDITIVDDDLAFAIAVDTPAPYGVPRGAIIDVAKVDRGRIGHDHVVFADFIPNAWSAWPNTYQHVAILERGPARAVVRTERDWGKVVITTVYTLAAGSDAIAIDTTMRNDGDRPLPHLLSGMTLWPKGGFLFGVPGVKSCTNGPAAGALADHVVAYDARWSIALHAPYLDHVANECRDLFVRHDLAPGQSREFHAWLQVGAHGDLAPVVRADLAREHRPYAKIHGRVRQRGGAAVVRPVVVAERHGVPFAWAYGRDGSYALDLPAGAYQIYATAKDESQSRRVAVRLAPGADLAEDFAGLQPAGRLRFAVDDAASGAPLDARIAIAAGRRPVVEFLGRRTFFTALDRRGRADFPIAPGRYTFDVESGGGFLGPGRRETVDVAPGQTTSVAVGLNRLFDPPRHGWYAADLHHHADQAEAVTPPADLARSQLAAGLDLLFVSDHDSTVNHRALQRIALRRRVPFIPSVELSASWGHFNAYPLELGAPLRIDTATATIQQIIAEAHRLGASIVQVNHPFIPYGYFTSVAAGTAPGGFDPAFDLVEINAAAPGDDAKVLAVMTRFWNAGNRYYLAAGTDTHDVWNEVSGRVRTFAHIDGRPNAARFADALRAGHAYVSYGPLIYPHVLFGDDLKVTAGASFPLAFDFAAVAGMRRATLIGDGTVVATRDFTGTPRRAHAEFRVAAKRPGWFAITAEDAAGRMAYSDPIWVDVVDAASVARSAEGARAIATAGSRSP